ncbi:hypothetical protein B2J93_2108 [Marssonina coronariae]|uniref:Uncharacterized protein n=1 Tax=Diplocarpon coronariae TaxID=2795749 RepID=A0A218Z1H1_9HELO|nr:hypothetical protein B2J93_2108 [Marssonina coronariae]
MDEFAQSREDDDLFADEFEPVAVSAAIIEQQAEPASVPAESRTGARKTTKQQQHPKKPAGQQQQPRNGRVQGAGGRGGANGLSQSRFAPKAQPQAETLSRPHSTSPTTSSPPATTIPSKVGSPPTATHPAPAPEIARTYAVRGDRSATGGKAIKKLTEAELIEKMAKMAILNKERAEKHRLTEADQAAFLHRERELAKERREKAIAEKKNERAMEMERAKNRQRKMKAQGGREWDSEKLESDIVDRSRGRTSEYVRGGHGGVIRSAGLAGSKYSTEDGPKQVLESRGRGGFEIRGRGRGGKTGRGAKQNSAVPRAEDFPSLPTAKKAEPGEAITGTAPAPAEAPPTPSAIVAVASVHADEKLLSLASEKPAGDWAEEMAATCEEKT